MKFDTENLSKEQLSHKIGVQIKFYRNQLGISQSELARRCDKDKQHIELIENGKVSPNIYTMYIISKALEIELNQLMELT
jgi:transcriptional regulator with XRE-family HTH domain